MWDSIKSFSKVQQDNIPLLAMIKISSKIFRSDAQLGFKTMYSFLLVDNERLFFTKFSFEKFEMFFTADRSTLPALKRNEAAKFLKIFRYILYSIVKKVTFLKGKLCICKYFILDVLYILRSV